jgi:iron(III) transport system substrate-binding protein
MRTIRLLAASLFAALSISMMADGRASAADRYVLAAPDGETERLVVRGATDYVAMEPLLRDFQVLWPHITVEYYDYVTSDLLDDAENACRKQEPFADLILSSAVDHLVKLANDGCALASDSPALAGVPDWARWRNEVVGFTFEPAVIVYNRDEVPAGEVPHSHTELADLLRTRQDRYRGRVGTYDIRLSGIGYLFAFSDLQQTSTTYGRLLESMGRAYTTVRCCTSQILEEVASGRLLIGYNMLGSYAYALMKLGAPIGIVLPRDYTLVLARGALLPRPVRNIALGRLFLDYLLSDRGQAVGREKAFFFAPGADLPPGVDGPPPTSTSVLRPIAIGPSLLPVQDRAKRKHFIADWSSALIDMNTQN